ncbi:MAG: ABC transporter permease [Actinomycetota bacterium]|nr:ABC transporter permease [Actinomycetota bacterium]
MSIATTRAAPTGAARLRPTGIGTVYRVELAKIASQLLPRIAAAVCLVGPFAFTIFINTQTSVPADALFGRWVHSSGFAIPFVVLVFGGIVGFPLITAVVAGDLFASEDGYATWKTMLTRSCSRGDIFAGKCLAGVTFSAAMVALLVVSSTLAGVLVVGTQPLIGLSGQVLDPGRALVLILESFAVALAPALAFTCVGILFSVVSRNSMIGVLGPPVVGLLMLLVSLMGSGVVVRSMLLITPFDAWHGLLVAPAHITPLWVGALVCAAYAFLCLDAARRSFRRRDFTGDGRAAVSWSRFGRGVLVALGITGILALGAAFDRRWITSHRLERSVDTTFKNLLIAQQDLLGNQVKERSLLVFPLCKRDSVVRGPSSGAGDDWGCDVIVDGGGFRGLSVSYSITVRPNGCYTAEGPPLVIGPLRIQKAGGGVAVNPLYAFDGCMIAP